MMPESKPVVLVVDDMPENLDLMAGILSDDYQVKAANNGARALNIARSSKPPDIILLDVMMPEMDGYEVCRRLKTSESTRDIPIIFVSAMSETEDESTGFAVGAVDYITKPVSPPVVLARVKTHLTLKSAFVQLEEYSDKIARFVAPQLKDSIIDGTMDARLETHRSKITVFFSDIVGFTSLSDNLEPEDLSFMLNGYLQTMADIVLKHGGTLDKFIGDAVLVFFGEPHSRGLKEDALSCISMALDMQKAVSELSKELNHRGIQPALSTRTGISTGFCTVGNFGSEQRMDYTIIGRHANLASRLETAAEPGQILISKETWVLVNEEINCRQRDPINAKGFAEPIEVYEVLGLRAGKSGLQNVDETHQGFTLKLQPDLLNSDKKEWVAKTLREALHELEKANADR